MSLLIGSGMAFHWNPAGADYYRHNGRARSSEGNTSVSSNRSEGFLRNLAGRFQDVMGGMTGDTGTQLQGKAHQAARQVQDAYGEALDHVERVASSRPLLAVTAGVGVGFMLGFLVTRR